MLQLNVILGTVNPLESFSSRCPPTDENDYSDLVMGIITATNLTVFLLTNLILLLRCVFHYEDNNTFQDCRLKTMTIGVALVVGGLGFFFLLQLLPKSNFDMIPNYTLITLIESILLLYVIKEQEFTIPFTLNLLKSLWNRCQNTNNAVVPLQPQVLPMQKLNPRALLSNDCSVVDLEDDGGIFMG